MAQDVQPLLVRMSAELHQAVKTTAENEDRTMAQVVRQALREYTETPKKQRTRRLAPG